MSDNDLPTGYRWATADETETYAAYPEMYPNMRVVVRTVDATGKPYTQGEADLALPTAVHVHLPDTFDDAEMEGTACGLRFSGETTFERSGWIPRNDTVITDPEEIHDVTCEGCLMVGIRKATEALDPAPTFEAPKEQA